MALGIACAGTGSKVIILFACSLFCWKYTKPVCLLLLLMVFWITIQVEHIFNFHHSSAELSVETHVSKVFIYHRTKVQKKVQFNLSTQHVPKLGYCLMKFYYIQIKNTHHLNTKPIESHNMLSCALKKYQWIFLRISGSHCFGGAFNEGSRELRSTGKIPQYFQTEFHNFTWW